MNLSPKYISFFVLLIFAFFGYHAFLVQRDNKMFDAYYGKMRYHQHCEELKSFHPDCR